MHPLMHPSAERRRLAALSALEILDTAPEERFDRITGVVRRIFGVPVASINLIDADRQWVKSGSGVEPGSHVPRQQSFCHHTIQHDETLVVADVLADARFRDLPMVQYDPGFRFYAGHPLHASTGEPVGTLCIADIVVRQFTAEQADLLAELTRLAEQEMARTPAQHEPATARRPVSCVAPQVPGWEIAGRCAPARRALGNFYDWYATEDHVQLRSADVTGRPLAVTEVSAQVDALLPSHDRISERTASPRSHSRGSAPRYAAIAASFVSAFAGRLTRESGHLTYVNVGCGLALVLQSDGGHRRLHTSRVPLGISAAVPPRTHTTTLAFGETLLVLSDGFLTLEPSAQRAADRALTRIRRHYRLRLTAHDAVELAAAWAAGQGHSADITTIAVARTWDELSN